jgi:N-acetylglutamate synthase-like GNAT family acetyltransferase
MKTTIFDYTIESCMSIPTMLRPATQADQAAIKQIVREARINPTGLAWKRFLVAVADGQIVSVGQVKPHFDGSRELASIATVPARQGQGFAGRIIGELLDRERGDLYLVCGSTLVRFYERFGFHRAEPGELTPLFRLVRRTTRYWGGAVMKRPAPVDHTPLSLEG